MGQRFFLAFAYKVDWEDLYRSFGDWVTSKTNVRSSIEFLNWYDDGNIHLSIHACEDEQWQLETFQLEMSSHEPMFSEELMFVILSLASKKLSTAPKQFLAINYSADSYPDLYSCVLELAKFFHRISPCVIINEFGDVYTYEEALEKVKDNEDFLWSNWSNN